MLAATISFSSVASAEYCAVGGFKGLGCREASTESCRIGDIVAVEIEKSKLHAIDCLLYTSDAADD